MLRFTAPDQSLPTAVAQSDSHVLAIVPLLTPPSPADHAGNFFGSMLGELLEQTTSVGEGNLQVTRAFIFFWAALV